MAKVQSEKSLLLSQCSQLQQDLAESKEKLRVTEERVKREENNCQLLMDAPFLGGSETEHDGYLKSLNVRQSQRLISSNIVRIMLLEKQNSKLRNHVTANSSRSSCSSSSSQRNEVCSPVSVQWIVVEHSFKRQLIVFALGSQFVVWVSQTKKTRIKVIPTYSFCLKIDTH